ncbi:cytochrome b/c1 domain protein [Anaplasma phagocytophilum str. CR1007]|nr:cytochrome b/c1 domain protein [Anaplasma phagocytophilum str. CR1007]
MQYVGMLCLEVMYRNGNFQEFLGHLIDQRCSGDIRCIERCVRVATL